MTRDEIIQAIKDLPAGEDIYLDTDTPSFTNCGHECTDLNTDDLRSLVADL